MLGGIKTVPIDAGDEGPACASPQSPGLQVWTQPESPKCLPPLLAPQRHRLNGEAVEESCKAAALLEPPLPGQAERHEAVSSNVQDTDRNGGHDGQLLEEDLPKLLGKPQPVEEGEQFAFDEKMSPGKKVDVANHQDAVGQEPPPMPTSITSAADARNDGPHTTMLGRPSPKPVCQCGVECPACARFCQMCGARLVAAAQGVKSLSWWSTHARSDQSGLHEIKQNFVGILLEQIKELDAGVASALPSGRSSPSMPRIVIVGHPNMHKLISEFVKSYSHLLANFGIIGNTEIRDIVEAASSTSCASSLTVVDPCLPSGPLGGDSCISRLIFESEVQAIFYFRDPLSAHVHKSDTTSLARLADTYQSYFCTNYRTAAAILEELHAKMIEAQPEPL
eukprot:TRINITY_DN122547_c0_g1_i1.p1 TRINITY_DN122547_c0_g1~~TRINITY_DN122547_c0_g1_i1.p1  ORF type:complete len:393 (+),score=67.26 TRINITY_DN122547_c0_g1_i1:84-1262(+)